MTKQDKQKIIIGSDHAAYQLKDDIKKYLKDNGYEYEDVGTHSGESCDYPDYALKAAEKVVQENARGILICGTGIGMSMAANKVKGIRAALCHNEETARMTREHNDANILCIGSRIIDKETALKIAKVWLETPFSRDERHAKRIKKVMDIEKC